MGQFYASLESGHTTASTALKRLVAYSGKNHFYRANRELGRVFKTEYMLQFMSDPLLRQRTRRGLLKGEQLHALAREVSYDKQGRMTARMSRTGNGWDNAVMERLFATLKAELPQTVFPSHAAARQAIFDDIERCDHRQRRHATLNYLSPVAYEQQHAAQRV